ncbi:alternative splicing regulator-domain-containing protein [Halteromyces radiatus]|uniref:alternative splicing regulator-domain-containing protein n=1 Tax=Halteromyces radiatus TaxID=101107 RepID=UPI0022210A11|nr:alternative splicing regulator-domain-containing protein [Halteromyces radiatus]KAI8093796.1 alternative splicing regulator-domain-containing protein [Halteromyces radiatus]
MLVFGYGSKLFDNKVLAQKVEDGKFLIPWQSNDDNQHLMLDRYDIRHMMDNLDDISDTFGEEFDAEIEAECDQERYADLRDQYGDTADEEEDENAIAGHKRKRTGNEYRYDYDKDTTTTTTTTTSTTANKCSSDIQSMIQQYNVPETMSIPSSPPLVDLIDKTALNLITTSKTNRQPIMVCEIQFQVRHCQDPQYDFLGKQHDLYPFYRQVLHYHQINSNNHLDQENGKTTLGSLVDYGSDSSNDEDDDNDKTKQDMDNIPTDVIHIIQKTAQSVAKIGLDLEHKIRRLRAQDPKFGFLQTDHPHHDYYRRIVESYQQNLTSK